MASKHGPKELPPEGFKSKKQLALADRILMLTYGMTPEQYAKKYISPLLKKEFRKQSGGHLGTQGRIMVNKYLQKYIEQLSQPTAIDEYFGEYNPQKALETFKYGVEEPQREKFMKEVPAAFSQKYGKAFGASDYIPAYATEQAESANQFARDIATQRQDFLSEDMRKREQERMNLIASVTSGQQVYNVPREKSQNLLQSFTTGAAKALPGMVETYVKNAYDTRIQNAANNASQPQKGQSQLNARAGTQAAPMQRFGQANNLNR